MYIVALLTCDRPLVGQDDAINFTGYLTELSILVYKSFASAGIEIDMRGIYNVLVVTILGDL